MGRVSAGQVAFIRFPFGDLLGSKVRPVVVIAYAGLGEWLVCQITSNPRTDRHALVLDQQSFASGSLNKVSYVRPAKVFTADEKLIVNVVGTLSVDQFASVQDAIVMAVRGGLVY